MRPHLKDAYPAIAVLVLVGIGLYGKHSPKAACCAV